MSDGFDLEQSLQNDTDTVQSAVKGGFSRPPLGQIIVQAVFTLGVLAVIMMLVMLPFVGTGKPIPGRVWVGGGVLFIVVFFGVGFALKFIMRVLKEV